MTILAFDTTMAAVSVAVWRDGVTCGRAQAEMERGQAEALAPLIERAMRDAGVAFAELARIAVTIGPGSFTGVRVGLASARGFGLVLGIPVIGVTTGEVLAHGAANDGTVVALIDTKREDFYVEAFAADGRRLAEPHGASAAEVRDAMTQWPRPITLVGDGAAAMGAPSARVFPDPVALAMLAARREPTVGGPLPVYVRPPAVTIRP